MSQRAAIIAKVRKGWPEHAGNTVTVKRGIVEVPPVRSGGLTAALIDFAVDTAIAELEASK